MRLGLLVGAWHCLHARPLRPLALTCPAPSSPLDNNTDQQGSPYYLAPETVRTPGFYTTGAPLVVGETLHEAGTLALGWLTVCVC